jgi:hypothetical protein
MLKGSPMIYDNLLIELETLCKEGGIDLDEDFVTLAGRMNHKELADHYHVCERTILNWKTKHGLNTKCETFCYPKVDALIREGKTAREAMDIVGISKSMFFKRKKLLGLTKPKPPRTEPYIPQETREPVYPINFLLERGLKAKARAIGKPLSWVREYWLQGNVGREWAQQMGATA